MDIHRSAGQRRWRVVVLGLVLTVGLVLALVEPVDRHMLLAYGAELAASPWTAPLLVVAQIALFALGLPGSVMVWLVAPFYPPLIATLLMLVGSVAGAAAAYVVAGFLGESVHRRLSHRRAFRILATRSDFVTQLALRVLPGFPHGIVNYAAGLLQLRWLPYLAAALTGLSIKWAVYCYAIHGLFERGLSREGPGAGALLPLVLLTLFLGLGSWVGARIKARAGGRRNR